MTNIINLNKTKNNKLIFDKPGDFVVFFHNLSGEYVFELVEKSVRVDIYGLYTGNRKKDFKIKTTQYHKAPGSFSSLLIKGVFTGESSFNYQGLIHIEKQAAKVEAYQKNQNLVLSDNVFINAKPFLEILNNDVYCTHGFSTGVLSEEELAYLMMRGISKEKAKELLVKGFMSEVKEKIDSLNTKR